MFLDCLISINLTELRLLKKIKPINLFGDNLYSKLVIFIKSKLNHLV